MFTLEQLKRAHSNIKSGADFPRYVQELIKLGVTGYETYVINGHTVYVGKEGFTLKTDPVYEELTISETSHSEEFKRILKEHQQGKSTFIEFCTQCAGNGVYKWIVNLEKLTCTYYNHEGNEVLEEQIPLL